MSHIRLLAVGLVVAMVVLGGCATSRSELRLTSPVGTQTAAPKDNRPVAIIRTVKDERTFEQAPRDPSTPSLGFEGAAQATAEAKLRAIGRKRNTYGMALGDVFLQAGQTVESVVRENLSSVLREAGYDVRSDEVTDSSTIVIDVHIRKFWAWVNPGFWAVTVNTDIATDLSLSTTSNSIPVFVHVDDARQFVTDSAWLETVDKALKEYRREATGRLSSAR